VARGLVDDTRPLADIVWVSFWGCTPPAGKNALASGEVNSNKRSKSLDRRQGLKKAKKSRGGSKRSREDGGEEGLLETPELREAGFPLPGLEFTAETTQEVTLGVPYTGDFRGVGWNAQALCAVRSQRHRPKRVRAFELIRKRDFMGVTDTHGNRGKFEAMAATPGVRRFWAEGTATQAGVSLWVQEAFLENFNKVKDDDWKIIVKGRLAFLNLRGPKGNCQLWVCYMPTGKGDLSQEVLASLKEQRNAVRLKIAEHMGDRRCTLSILMGDMNTVANPSDRWCKQTSQYTGGRDEDEERHWERVVAEPTGLVELKQEEPTFESAKCLSRIDRVYTNQHLVEQLDRNIACAALHDDKNASDHRPVAFSRTCKPKQDSEPILIPDYIVKIPEWKHRVVREFLEQSRAADKEQGNKNELRDLDILKKAVVLVSQNMLEEINLRNEKGAERGEAESLVAYIRAAEKGRTAAMRKCISRCPSLQSLVDNAHKRGGNISALQLLKDKAIELFKKDVISDIEQGIKEETDEEGSSEKKDAKKAARNNQVASKLKRLKPGASNSLSAVRNLEGEVVTDSAEMAEALKKHWAKTFKASKINRTLLEQWLKEESQCNEPMGKDLPSQEDESWDLLPRHMKKAIDDSGVSRPGPDGIPYAAYKVLGVVGCSVLFRAAAALANEDGLIKLRTACGTGADGVRRFNEALMVFLPKKPSGQEGDTVFYEPGDTRPLAIVNTDNRLIASAYRILLEPLLESCISPDQRGFLPGRSILANVADIEEN